MSIEKVVVLKTQDGSTLVWKEVTWQAFRRVVLRLLFLAVTIYFRRLEKWPEKMEPFFLSSLPTFVPVTLSHLAGLALDVEHDRGGGDDVDG